MEPANDPNASPALDAAPVEPVVQPVAPTEPVAPVEPTAPDLPGEPGAPEVAAPTIPEEPVAPEVPAEPTEPAEHNTPEYLPESYNSFMEAANKVLTDNGINTTALAEAINAADGKVTDEIRKIIVDKLGAAEATMIISGYESEMANVSASIEAEAAKVFDVVGGKEMWDKMAAWAATPESGLAPEAKAEYNSMLAKGGIQAALAAEAIKGAYMQSPGFTQDPSLLTGDQQPSATPGMEPISRSQYITAKSKAINENNGVEVQSLEARARFTREHHTNEWYGARYNG